MCESVTVLRGGRVLHVSPSQLEEMRLRGGDVFEYAAEIKTYKSLHSEMLMPEASVDRINSANRRGKRVVVE